MHAGDFPIRYRYRILQANRRLCKHRVETLKGCQHLLWRKKEDKTIIVSPSKRRRQAPPLPPPPPPNGCYQARTPDCICRSTEPSQCQTASDQSADSTRCCDPPQRTVCLSAKAKDKHNKLDSRSSLKPTIRPLYLPRADITGRQQQFVRDNQDSQAFVNDCAMQPQTNVPAQASACSKPRPDNQSTR